MAIKKCDFFTYKGLPLVRKGREIYYGNMTDDYVVMMQIVSTEKINGLDVANRVRLFRMATDDSLPPNERINKTAEKTSLYDALVIASAWLSDYIKK